MRWLVRATALVTWLAVGTGLLHAAEGGFSGERLELHRNLGLALGVFALVTWVFYERLVRAQVAASRTAYRIGLVGALCVLVPAGHFGAELTHGPGFLTEPLSAASELHTPQAQLEPSSYEQRIRPLLDAKCVACHGEKKRKGGLTLADSAGLLAGGKHGPVLIPSAPHSSPLLARIELALDDDHHMPPSEREQLDPQELELLRQWIVAGAPLMGRLELPQPLATADAAATTLAVPAAPAAALLNLRAALAHVQPVGADSNLLWIDFSATAKTLDDAAACALLEPVSAQLADLSLARSKIGAATLAALAKCSRLERLDLRASGVDDAAVASLVNLPRLSELVLSQTALSDQSIDALLAMPALKSVHLWRSGISAEGLIRLRAARPQLSVEDGSLRPSSALEVEPDLVLSRAAAPAVISSVGAALTAMNAKCPVSNTDVDPKYLVVYEGRVIGFCCAQCPASFWADPAKFLDRLE
jgi:hypothetical protein